MMTGTMMGLQPVPNTHIYLGCCKRIILIGVNPLKVRRLKRGILISF